MLAWKQLTLLADEHLAKLDVALVNLACAVGLPDSGEIDFARTTERLNDYARCVRDYTRRSMPQFHRAPEKYRNSESFFRVLCIITHLQRDLGVRYNPEKIDVRTPLDAPDSFVHGALFGLGGTCASLPVLYASIGRRLGYPLKIVQTKAGEYLHLFNRWEGNGERFNIEASGIGLNCYTDEHYSTGIHAATKDEIEKSGFLESKTPRQEMAGFLGQRACHWRNFRKMREQVEALAWAYELNPQCAIYWNGLARAVHAWHNELEARKPPTFPTIHLDGTRRVPSNLGRSATMHILGLEVTENLLNDPEHDRKWWTPLRNGLTPDSVPVHCNATLTENGCGIRLHFRKST